MPKRFVPSEEQRRELRATHPFGPWLLAQRGRDQWIGQLAKFAAADPRFPRQGSESEVRHRIQSQAVDEDMLGALTDALSEWRRDLDRIATQH